MRRCVFGKDTLRLFPIRAQQSTLVVAQPDERLANRTQKRVLRIGVVRQTQSALFIRTNQNLLQ